MTSELNYGTQDRFSVFPNLEFRKDSPKELDVSLVWGCWWVSVTVRCK